MVEVEAVVESGFWIHIQALMVSNGSFGTAFFPLIFELMARYTAKNGVNHLLRWYNNNQKKKLVPATRPCLRMTSRSEMSVQPQFRRTDRRNTGRCCVVCFCQNATKSKASRTQSTSVKDTPFLKLASPNLKSCCTKSEATDRIFFFGKFRLTSIAAF